ncbi:MULTISPECIES: MFS transporter [Amycolatopsis]|uniref:MHS family MFS transporter n=1 Tax=Amycolatopsis thermalba TaxID=944492 RepID=A0ABY4NYN1_9PSEU|nr:MULTISPECIES: MFS transporter [Amycolatopsis]OXM75233.1 MFS transporter [Amycolatopsis sp. KNN50.9b]UQS25169.1 MHS family MFS transporter [Amycolatopsis thermalba]
MTHQQAVSAPGSGTREARRVAVASFVGTAIEWYDFFLYGAAAALVFGPQFFPSGNPAVSQLASLTTFAVGFLARPVGGIVAGHFGDRIGRKRMLVISLLIMGTATVLVGLLPTYAQIGVAAPILLVVLRLAQGVGVGAEWGGAALMAVEHAPPSRRGLYGAAPQLGVPAGAIAANLVLLVASTSTREAFVEWGWRLGFLVSFVLVIFGLVIRRRLTESPLFEQAARQRPARVPLLEVLRDHPLAVVRSVFVTGASTAMGYIILTYILSYGTAEIGYSRNALLVVVILTSVVQLGAIYGLSGLADRFGRRKVIAAGAIAQAVAALLFFLVFDTGVFVLALVACVVAVITVSAQYGPLPALLSDQFPTRIRYSGVSLGYQLGNVVGGGLAPVVATAIFTASGSSLLVGVYLAGMALLALVAVALTPRGDA